MQPEDLHGRIDDVQVLDVREMFEWQAGHIDGAVHIPMSQLGARQSEIATDRDVVVVCRSGNRSAAVTGALQRAGYPAFNLEGGMQAWAARELPFVADGGAAPAVA